MREELSFAVSHPTHGEVHLRRGASSPLSEDEEDRPARGAGAGGAAGAAGRSGGGADEEEEQRRLRRVKEEKAMDRSNSIQNLLALAHHHSGGDAPSMAVVDEDEAQAVDEVGVEVELADGPRRPNSGARRRHNVRRHNSLTTPHGLGMASMMMSGEDRGFEKRAFMHKCQEAAEAMDLISKAVAMGNHALGAQLQKHVDYLSLNLRRMDELELPLGAGGASASHLKHARRMARHINAEVAKARRSKWNQMLGYSDAHAGSVALGSPAGSVKRRSMSLVREPHAAALLPRKQDAEDGDDGAPREDRQAARDGPAVSIAIDGLEALGDGRGDGDGGDEEKKKRGGLARRPRAFLRFLRTNLFTSTAPALLLCLLYAVVILVLSIHEEKHYATRHVHAVPYTHYLSPEPLRVVEVEVKYGGADAAGHRRSRGLRRALGALGRLPGPGPQFTLSLEQMRAVPTRIGNATVASPAWLPLRVQLLESYDADEISHHLALRPGEYPGRVGGAPLRLVLVSTAPARVAYVRVLQQGWIGDAQRWIALAVLAFVLLMIAVEIVNRVLVAMFGSFAMLLLLVVVGRPPTLPQVIEWVDEGTLGLLFGMMIMVGKLSATGFFELATLQMVGMSRGRSWYLFVILCLLTAALSAFLDNVTTVLLIAPATLELCKKLEVDPIPFLVGEILFSNIGGAATMIGDPPNVIVGNALSSELTFTDFLAVLAPGVLLISPFAIGLLRYTFRSSVTGELRRMHIVMDMRKDVRIADRPLFYKSAIVLGVTVLLFLLHPVHHTDPAWIALLGAGTLMLVGSPHDIHHDLEYVEWDTLIFFASLFVMVEAMGEVGLIRGIGDVLTDIIKSVPASRRVPAALSILMWASALISGFLDNIPYTATMVPIIQQLANAGLGLEIKPLAFALCFGACLGGNGSLVGASANIVVAGIAERMGHTISFNSFIRVSFPVMLLSVAIANGYLVLRY